MNMQMPLTFNEGVYLVPVRELPEGALGTLDVSDADFALTRPQGRTGSKIIDRDAAELVKRFREPRTIVEAVVLFSRAQGEDPQEVLSGAFAMLKGLVNSGYLVEVVDGAPRVAAAGPLSARWSDGDSLAGGRVLRCLQVLEDTELYLIMRDPSSLAVVKVERWSDGAAPTGHLRGQLERERRTLDRLDGRGAPRLLGDGEVDGRAYIVMEFIAGVDAEAEALRLRQRGEREGRGALLSLAQGIAHSYASLHEQRVLHGDVHPRNLLIDRRGKSWLIDFGLSVALDAPADVGTEVRGGIPFFFEPELARAALAGRHSPPATPAGEQYAVAALLYFLLTGAHTRDFSLGRDEMLHEIAELPALPFAERGCEGWHSVEVVLARALAKDPAARWPGLREFADALMHADDGDPRDSANASGASAHASGGEALAALADRCMSAVDVGGAWEAMTRLPAPSASINYGAAGVAAGLLSIAQSRDDRHAFALSQHWLRRAACAAEDDDAFYNAEIDITPATVGAASPYHSVAGVHLVAALTARSMGDADAQRAATDAFLAASRTGHAGLDLTLGTSSTLLGAALLLDALPEGLDDTPLLTTGSRIQQELWTSLNREPVIADASIEYLGIAHGWAGFLYATLEWSAVAQSALPAEVDARLSELASLSSPVGRGLTWPWTLQGPGRAMTMPGWCNGSCGYVFLWTAASRMLSAPRYLDLAVGAAWDAWDAPDQATTLCCGTAGRAYALLNLYRATGDAAWLERARVLAHRGAAGGTLQPERAHCLWKGDFGLAVLHAELARPTEARMPIFERAGWRDTGR